MHFPNLLWAVRQGGSQFQLAAALGESESWLSRRLTGRVGFTPEDRDRIAQALGYPSTWLFETPDPPIRQAVPRLEAAGIHA
jgi:transcriptional regulator with XRE-family HTH domain